MAGFKKFAMHVTDDAGKEALPKLRNERVHRSSFAASAATDQKDLDPETAAKRIMEQALASKSVSAFSAPAASGKEPEFRSLGTETIPLGPTHWARGLHAPVAFPFQRPSEASAMGGGVWQDNFDGTFTQLDDDYYVPATGWSYLDLYLMGLITASEVPDFFILRNLVPAGRDSGGRPIFKADRTKVTIQDVIAVEGQRLPDVDRAQKQFNTGMVVMVEHGKTPSQALIDRANGIRLAWIDYFSTTTGHRASMTATPK